MTSSTNTTRRGFLSTAAALGASAAVAIPADAADASTPDPIFEAIEAHKAARLAFENAVSRSSALDEELPGEKTRSWITVWEQTIVETDDPRWIDSVWELHRVSEAATDAACALASIAPTTMAGVVGLLQYAITVRPEEWPEGVQSDDDTETRPWHTFLIEMLIAVLPGMAVQSRERICRAPGRNKRSALRRGSHRHRPLLLDVDGAMRFAAVHLLRPADLATARCQGIWSAMYLRGEVKAIAAIAPEV